MTDVLQPTLRVLDLLDTIADIEAGLDEDGDPDGCSPFGCRSGASVDEGDAA